ncbi:hypothetical protein [Corynebacterium kalidii]|uniref:SRPBCC family protein n=1 Tax=Corynebacterium kalidii TaxID=2931982 RepID=A0A9X1WFR9_9CORY|nr:hypothetical protein [Corynebacterium kalidii]MCJ7857628.1 hypothetical protein [Corynebacterium kalidii]
MRALWFTTWGSTREERRRTVPGDSLTRPHPHLRADRAITLSAPPQDVWPWLMQLGQDRGGFYSWEFLENLLGSEVRGVRELRPEWSTRTVGDTVRLAPELPLTVHQVTQEESLVLVGGDPGAIPEVFTWAFVLTPVADGTRLHVRERYRFACAHHRLLTPFLAMASCVMTVRMLRTIRRLAAS